MRIYVTQMDIDEGWRGVPSRCAIARAASRQLGRCVAVGTSGWINWFDEALTIAGSDAQRAQFIKDFDNGRAVAPFWFDIPLEVEQPVTQEAVAAK